MDQDKATELIKEKSYTSAVVHTKSGLNIEMSNVITEDDIIDILDELIPGTYHTQEELIYLYGDLKDLANELGFNVISDMCSIEPVFVN